MAYHVVANGKALASGKTCVYNEFLVELRSCQSGRLLVEMEGPSRPEIHCMDMHDNRVKVNYKVSIPGDYRLQIKFNTFYVQGNPFHVHVGGSAPSSLWKHEGRGVIRMTRHTSKPLTFSSSAELMIGSDLISGLGSGGVRTGVNDGSVISSFSYSPLAVRYLSYN